MLQIIVLLYRAQTGISCRIENLEITARVSQFIDYKHLI